MQRPHEVFVVGSALLLVLAFLLLPVFEFDTLLSPRASVPSACAAAGGLIFAFVGVRRSWRWWRAAACLLVLLHGFLFVSLLYGIRSDLHAARLTTRSSEQRLAVGFVLHSTSFFASLCR